MLDILLAGLGLLATLPLWLAIVIAIRLSVKPGLTCLWQISGRSTIGFDQWMEFDREYIRKMSLQLDLSILVRTVWAVLSCRGAY